MDPSTREENQLEEGPQMGANLRSLLKWYIISCSSADLHISDIVEYVLIHTLCSLGYSVVRLFDLLNAACVILG